MRKSLLAALLAASVTLPAAAMAQDWHHHDHDRGNQADDARPAPAQQPRAERPARDQAAQPDRWQRPQAGGPRFAQPAPDQQGQRFGGPRQDGNANFGQRYDGRGPAAFGQAQPPVGAPNRDGSRGQWNGRGGDGNRWNGRGDANDGRTNGQRYGGGDWADHRNDGQRYDGQRYDGRRDDYNRGRYDGRPGGYNGYNNGRYDGAPNWSRDWHNDRRYDWNSYRYQNRSLYRLPRYYAPSGWGYGYRRFSIGVRLSSLLWDQNYWISDPWYYRLPPAYGPYRWVRYYNDALLIDLRTGYVVDTAYGIFW